MALVSDLEVVDDYPSTVLAHARRQQRWVRGDWQILLWLLPESPDGPRHRDEPAFPHHRWKILDNLRRSLVPPTPLVLLVAGWTFLPGRPALDRVVLAVLGARAARDRCARLAGRGPQPLGASCASGAGDVRRPWRRPALGRRPARLPRVGDDARDRGHAGAYGRSRRAGCSSGRRRRPPRPARSGLIGGRGGLRVFAVEMAASPLTAPCCSAPLVALWLPRRCPAAPFLVLWLLAPALALVLSQPVRPRRFDLGDEDRAFLLESRGARGATSSLVGQPPRTSTCRRTTIRRTRGRWSRTASSPTNIGLGLVSTLAAHDLGFSTPPGSSRSIARSRLHRGRRTPRRTPAQLVRHEVPGAASPAVRVHGRQRQPGRR